MDSGDSPPQLKGVVIITLPPPNDPSLGKTITAFTLSDPSPATNHQTQNQNQSQVSIQLPTNPQRNFSFRNYFLYLPRALVAFLGISIFVFILFCSPSFSKTLVEVRGSRDREERNFFVFPLYPKYGDGIEFKLGRFVGLELENVVGELDDGMRVRKKSKLVTTLAANAKSATFPVEGNIYPDGLYFTCMLVGNPPKPYFLDVDTGSDLTWIQCDAPCTSCAKGVHPLYKPAKGKILPFKDSLCTEIQRGQKNRYCETCQQCDYMIEYADDSSSMGVLAKDELHLMITNGSRTNYNVVFGCSYDQQGLLLNSLAKTDGILGLSRAKVSLPSQLATRGIINNVVGHCLSAKGGAGGYLFLGDDFVPYWGMAWVPMLDIPSEKSYNAEIVKMSYGKRQLSLDRSDSGVGQVAFDSGSSYTYFAKHAYNDLVTSLGDVSDELTRDASDPTLPICWRAKSPIRSLLDVKHFFKSITLHFESKWWIASTKFQIPPEGYLITSNKGNVCLGILDGSKVLEASTILLGDISMHGQLIVYDNLNNRIGWARSNCVQPERFKSLTSI